MVKKRFDGITSSDDFLHSEEGMTRLDAISIVMTNLMI